MLVSTSYLDEAERCDHVLLMYGGRVIGRGAPAEVSAAAAGRTFRADPAPGIRPRQLQSALMGDPHVVDAVPEGGRVRFVTRQKGVMPDLALATNRRAEPARPRFEDGFMVKLNEALGGAPKLPASAAQPTSRPSIDGEADVVVEVKDLVKQFGSFAAVDHVSFRVRRGEIFGLLGPNGAGKSTTFRMLCGLMPATGGTLTVAGTDVRRARASARRRIGYVSQKFALYGDLTAVENLRFFAAAYGLRGRRLRERVADVLAQFDLADLASAGPAGQLPGGYKQRLAMAAALLHEPETLFLDEPTSGVDPTARREFWRRITALADRGVTVIVTTHFMEEAEYCDRMVILASGRILAEGTPAEVRRLAPPEAGPEPTIEDAFIGVVEASRRTPQQPLPQIGAAAA